MIIIKTSKDSSSMNMAHIGNAVPLHRSLFVLNVLQVESMCRDVSCTTKYIILCCAPNLQCRLELIINYEL